MVFIGVYRAIYDYAPQTEGELEIKEGDLLFVLEKDDDWWRAKKKAPSEDEEEPEGLIPHNYVEEARSIADAKALYDYDRQTDEEISFSESTALHVYDTSDEDWTLVGHNGEFGFAPANYIEIGEVAPPTPQRPRPSAPVAQPVAQPAATPRHPDPSDSDDDDAARNPAAALAGILAARTGSQAAAPVSASSTQSTRRVQFTPPESEEDVPAPSLPRRRPSEATPPPPSVVQQPTPRSPSPPSVVASPPNLRVRGLSRGHEAEPALQSPRGFHIYNIYEMVEAMGKNKKMPVTLGINVAKGVIMISPEQSKDSTEWTADKLTHYALEGKHVFVELVRPSRSIDFHAGQKDTAQEIVSHLGELAGASKAEGLREVIAAGSGADQKVGKMIYDFMAAGEDEVSCAVDDEVLILDDSNDEWWLVKRQKNGKSGVVPSNYVEVVGLRSIGAPSSSTSKPSVSFVDQNRQEEERLAKQAASAKRAEQQREAEVGPGIGLPQRGSSLSQDDNKSKASQRNSASRDKKDSKPAEKKTLPDHLKCRTWTDRSATFKVEAEFLGLKDGKIHLHKLNGVKIAVPVAKMSIEDLEYVEWATGVSLDEDKPLSDIKRRNTQRQNDRNKDANGRTKVGASVGLSKPEYDWFDFFLQCGVNPQICERYASAFSRDQIGEEILGDINPQLLRTLGLKEGDILRVMKFLDTKFDRNKPVATPDGAGEESAGAGGLFSGPGGALRNNTRKGRPAPPVETSNVVDAGVFKPKTTGDTPTSPAPPGGAAASKAAPKTDLLGGFDDNAWEPRETRSPIASPPPAAPAAVPPPAAPQAPAVTESMADLSLLSPPLQPTVAPTAAPQAAAPPSPTTAQPSGATPSLFEQLANSKANSALNPPRQRPHAPQQTNTQNSMLAPPPQRATSAPQQQNAFAPPMLQPQPLLHMRTGIVGSGQSMDDQVRLQQMQQQLYQQQPPQQLMPQMTGYQQPNMGGYSQMPNAPMMPQATGFPGQQFLGPQQPGFIAGFQQPQPTGFQPGLQPNGSPFADPPRLPFQPQPTGFNPSPLQPQQTGINAFLPPALVPQATGYAAGGPPPNLGGGTIGQPPPPMPPMPPMPTQNQGALQPLVPQKTGPPPPVRFGTGPAQKLAPQPTGRRANLANASAQNPFGF